MLPSTSLLLDLGMHNRRGRINHGLCIRYDILLTPEMRHRISVTANQLGVDDSEFIRAAIFAMLEHLCAFDPQQFSVSQNL